MKLKTGKETAAKTSTTSSPDKAPDIVQDALDHLEAPPAKVKPQPTGTALALKADLKYPPLEITKNSETGSIFAIIGQATDPAIKVSVRLYMSSMVPENGRTRLDLRIRFGDADEKFQLPMATILKGKAPAIYAAASASSKQSGGHLSIEGAIQLPCNPWEHVKVHGFMADMDLADVVISRLQQELPGKYITGDRLRWELVSQAMKAVLPLTEPEVKAVPLRWRVGLTNEPLAKSTEVQNPGDGMQS